MTRTQLLEIYEALVEAAELIEGQIDVVDGDYGEPRANTAMRVHPKLEDAMRILDQIEAEMDKESA